jgi:hypothetical protein
VTTTDPWRTKKKNNNKKRKNYYTTEEEAAVDAVAAIKNQPWKIGSSRGPRSPHVVAGRGGGQRSVVRRSSRDARFQRASKKKGQKKEEETIKVATTLTPKITNPRRKQRGCPSY